MTGPQQSTTTEDITKTLPGVELRAVGGAWVFDPQEDITAKQLADCLRLVLLPGMMNPQVKVGEIIHALPEKLARHFTWKQQGK